MLAGKINHGGEKLVNSKLVKSQLSLSLIAFFPESIEPHIIPWPDRK